MRSRALKLGENRWRLSYHFQCNCSEPNVRWMEEHNETSLVESLCPSCGEPHEAKWIDDLPGPDTSTYRVGDCVELIRLTGTRINHQDKPLGWVTWVYTRAVEVKWMFPLISGRLAPRETSIEYFEDVRLL